MEEPSCRISLIIVSWNTAHFLRLCLSSIYATMDGASFEVIVFDNNSQDGTPEMVRTEFPHVRLIAHHENLGFARGNNHALQQARGDYLVLLNPDTELLPDAVARCVAFLERTPSAGMVGGELLNGDGSFQAGYFPFPTLRSAVRTLSGKDGEHFRRWKAAYSPHPPERRVDWIAGAFMVVRREAAASVGLLDERFFMFVEEMEWCYRFHKAGWAIHYLSEVKVIHHHRQSTKQVGTALNAHAVRGLQIFFWTHRSWFEAAAVTLLSALVGLVFLAKAALGRAETAEQRASRRKAGVAILAYSLDRRRYRYPAVPGLSAAAVLAPGQGVPRHA